MSPPRFPCARPLAAVCLGLALLAAGAGHARADLMLTPAAQAAGFGLTTFAFNFPNNGAVGPVGIGFPASGGVLVSGYASGTFYRLADVDGHDIAATPPSATGYAGNDITGIARIGSQLYLARQANGDVVRIDDNGALGTSVATGIRGATGIVAIPNGHLIVSQPGNFSLFDVNPATNSGTQFSNQYDFDGLSTDGTILYGAAINVGHILGVRLSDGVQVFDSGPVPDGVDGTALGAGTLAGTLFVNTNSGTVYEINLTTLAQTLIASGGSRGDFVTVDPNGSLLLTQTDQIKRLTAPSGGGFGVPEPSALALFGVGTLSLLGYQWRRRNRKLVEPTAG